MRRMIAPRFGSCRLLAGQGALATALALLSPLGSSGPMPTGKSTAQATASATVLEPISINGVLGGLFSVNEMLTPLQGAASPSTGSVLIRLVNTVPAIVIGGGDGGGTSSLSLLLASGRTADSGGMIAMLNGLLAPLSGGTLQRDLVAAVTMTSEATGLTGEPGQPVREGDERVAIVVAFN